MTLCFAAGFCLAGTVLTLSEAENLALGYSPRLKSLAAEQKAYEQRSLAQKTQSYPKLTLDGSYRYITTVPEIELPARSMSPVKMGDNTNYSVGPALNWTVWDSGGVKNTYRSAAAAWEAKKHEGEAARLQVLFASRAAYFQVALASEQEELLSDALKLANAQYEDIKLNVKAGTKSRADELKAHQEVLARMRQLSQSKSDKASALRELSAVTGQTGYAGLKIESIDTLLGIFERFERTSLDPKHPGLEALAKYAQSFDYSGRAAGSGNLPKLQLSVKSTLDYPNTTKLESFNQNTAAAAFSWPLFESGASQKRGVENEEYSKAYSGRKNQLESDLKKDWDKALEQLASLKEQKQINDISVLETVELSAITYKAYKTGSISFIEVENANFKALEAKMQSAKTKVQMLMNLAVLASISK